MQGDFGCVEQQKTTKKMNVLQTKSKLIAVKDNSRTLASKVCTHGLELETVSN
jgi:hypothetical protein